MTVVDRFDEGLNIALLAEDEGSRCGSGARINGNSGGIVAAVLQASEAVEENF